MAKPIEEQAKIEDKDLKGLLTKLKLNDEKNINPDIHLGIYYKKKDSEKEFRTFNYIGVDWLSDDRNKINKDETDYIIVKPKVKDLDFMKLFSSALGIEDEKAYTYFNDYFNIDFNVPRIKAQDSELDSYITPLLLFSYIQSVRQLLKHGLRKGYTNREENLKCKMKGHLMLSKHIVKNVVTGMKHRLYCSFTEYSYDIPENRILKKALNYSLVYFKSHKGFDSIIDKVNVCLSHFVSVSDDIQVSELRTSKTNKLFIDYTEALKLAKMILQRFNFSMDNASETEEVPVFWIDMSRLFEMHVLSLLRGKYKDEIVFQESGGKHHEKSDYIKKDECLIIDAKYKMYDGKSVQLADVREVAGNARNKKYRAMMKISDDKKMNYLNCIIIYPNKKCEENPFDSDKIMNCSSLEKEEKDYVGIYKLGIKLPVVKRKQHSD